MSAPVAALVAEKNAALMDALDKKVADLTKKIDDLIRSQAELTQAHHKFKEDVTRLLTDDSEKTTKLLGDFVRQYTDDSHKQKEEIMNKLSSEIKEFNQAVKDALASFDKSIKEKLEEFMYNTGEAI